MKFTHIDTRLFGHFIFVVVVLACVSACVSEPEMYNDETMMNENNVENQTPIVEEEFSEFENGEPVKYGKRYAQFVNYKIDRSYMNKVDYPLSVEAYYASRFTGKKKNVKKVPFLATPVSFEISENQMEKFIDKINNADGNMDLIEDELAIIRKQYAEVLSTSRYCCSYGLTSKFEQIGIEKDYIFKFMIDDKRMYELQSICMIINDSDIASLLGTVELAVITRDVRNSCVCKNQDRLSKQLSLFKSVLDNTNLFQQNSIIFKYINELGDVVKNNIGRDIINLLDTLEKCP